MSRLYNTFDFVGHVNIPRNKDKFHKVNAFDSGWEKHTLNFAVQESKTNSAFVELVGGLSKVKPNKVMTRSKNTENTSGSNLEIPWSDRLKPETVDMVADFRKIIIDLTTDKDLKEKLSKLRYEIRNLEYKDKLTEDEQEKLNSLRAEHREKAVDRYEFIHPYDAVILLSTLLESYKEYRLHITGSINFSYWNGNFYRNFTPELIEIADEETPNKLRATMDVFFTKGALDEKDFKKDKKIYVDGYVISRDNAAKKDAFFPQQFVINAQKVDLENEDHVKRLEFLKKKFDVSKAKTVNHLQWQVNIFRGADKVDFTEKDLTAAQKEAIEFGYNKLEDFAPKGGMLGDNVYENRLVKPNLQKVNDFNDFTSGAVESEYSVDDLEYTPVQQESKKEEKQPEPKKEITKQEVELDDLFS